MTATKKYAIAFTSVFAIVVLFFITLNISSINVNAAVTAPSENSSSLSSSKIALGKSITVYGRASGGTGDHFEYMYQYQAPGTSSFITFQEYTKNGNIDFTPTQAGNYTIRVSAKTVGSDGTSSSGVVKNLSLTVVELTNTSSISASSITLDNSVTITGSATGGSSYKYKYTYTYSNQTYYISPSSSSSEFTSSTSVNFKPSKTGSYTITVVTKDTSTNATSKKQFSLVVNDKTYSMLISNSSINTGTVEVGNSITLTGNASGGKPPYQYQFSYSTSSNGTYYIIQSKSTTKTVTYTPNYSGTYYFKVTIWDSNNDYVQETLSCKITPKSYTELQNTSSISATSCFQGKGGVTLKGSAAGGSTPYTYSYRYKKSGESEWQYINGHEWVGNTAVNFDPDDADTYDIQIVVKDNKGTQVKNSFSLNVKAVSAYTRENLAELYKDFQTWYYQLTSAQKEKIVSTDEGYGALATAVAAAESALNDTNNNQDWDTLYINLSQEFDKAKDNPPSTGTGTKLSNMTNTITKWLGEAFKSLGNALFYIDYDENSSNLFAFDAYGFAISFSDVGGVINIFATSLLVLLWGVNLLNSALQYELFTLKGFAKSMGYLMLSKIWVDLSITVCYYIYQICHDLLGNIVSTISMFDFGSISIITENAFEESGVWIIGPILDFFMVLGIIIMVLVLAIPLLIFIVQILTKLFTRNFEIGLMMVISPVFFACLCGEETKQYFKRFITSFISVVAEILYMGIVYAAFMYYLHDWTTVTIDLGNLTADSSKVIFGYFGFGIAFIGACILMKKPPKILKNLVS